jgi:hypothetical protein
MRVFIHTSLTVALVTSVAPAVDPVIDGKSGLKVSENAPPFKLKDQDGKERTLEEFMKKGVVALVFYRSAGW